MHSLDFPRLLEINFACSTVSKKVSLLLTMLGRMYICSLSLLPYTRADTHSAQHRQQKTYLFGDGRAGKIDFKQSGKVQTVHRGCRVSIGSGRGAKKRWVPGSRR